MIKCNHIIDNSHKYDYTECVLNFYLKVMVMKYLLKKILSLTVGFVMLLAVITVNGTYCFAAAVSVDNGTCGDDLTWTLDVNGTLTVSGTGDMYDYIGENPTPWDSYEDEIKRVDIKNDVTGIGKSAFFWCRNLESVTIGKSVTKINNQAFAYCNKLSEIIIPESVISIGISAFAMCSSLNKVILSDGLKNIGAWAFHYCEELEEITIPSSVEKIENEVFLACSSLTEITVNENNNHYSSADGVLYNDIKTEILCYPMAKSGDNYIVPGTVSKIHTYAFCGNLNLEKIVFPQGVREIGSYAFSDCQKMTDVYYFGNESDWQDVEISRSDVIYDENNTSLFNSEIHYNCREEVKKDATCISKGYSAGIYCPDCNEYAIGYEEIPIDAATHNNTKTVPVVEATYSEVGYTEGVYCNDCQKYISGHTEMPKLISEFSSSENAKLDGAAVVANAGVTCEQLLVQAGEGAVIKNVDGSVLDYKTMLPGTGMKVVLADGTEYDLIVLGDADSDGTISSADARLALRTAVGLESFGENSAYYRASNVDGDKVSSSDARLILRAAVGLEDNKKWLK